MYVTMSLSFLLDSFNPFNSVHLDRLGSMPEDTVRFYMAQLSSALAFLHDSNIMHR